LFLTLAKGAHFLIIFRNDARKRDEAVLGQFFLRQRRLRRNAEVRTADPHPFMQIDPANATRDGDVTFDRSSVMLHIEEFDRNLFIDRFFFVGRRRRNRLKIGADFGGAIIEIDDPVIVMGAEIQQPANRLRGLLGSENTHLVYLFDSL